MILQRALEARGVSCTLILPFYRSDPVTYTRTAIAQTKARIVAYSFRNLDSAGFHFSTDGGFSFVRQLLSILPERDVFDGLVVLGGSGFSIAPAELMEKTAADIGFMGPSEDDFAEFCVRVLHNGLSAADAVKNLRSVAMPDTVPPLRPVAGALGKIGSLHNEACEVARLVGGTVPVRTKTGCSLKCSYCVVPSIEPLRLRTWDEIQDELKMWVTAGLGNRVFIADGEFNLPSVQRAIEISDRIRNTFGETVAWRCYLEAGYITRGLVAALKAANCVGISLTVDSLADAPRKGFAKGTSAQTALEGIRICLESGIQTGVNLLFGGPGETIETALETARLAKALCEQGAGIAVTVGLRVYPNTPLHALSLTEEHKRFYQAGVTYEWLGVYCSPVSPEELAKHVVPVLGDSPMVQYTNTVSADERSIFQRIASATTRMTDRDLVGALSDFEQLALEYPMRGEPRLGILKCKLRISDVAAGR